MKKRDVYVTGRTANSMHVRRFFDRVGLFVPEYLPTLETGRKAGKIPKNFLEIIQEWMRNRGMKRNTDFANAIVWNTHYHGSRSKKYPRIIYNDQCDQWEKKYRRFLKNVDYLRYMENENDNENKN